MIKKRARGSHGWPREDLEKGYPRGGPASQQLRLYDGEKMAGKSEKINCDGRKNWEQ
jgi:hypothetical protein